MRSSDLMIENQRTRHRVWSLRAAVTVRMFYVSIPVLVLVEFDKMIIIFRKLQPLKTKVRKMGTKVFSRT
jgi:hypothetical protein